MNGNYYTEDVLILNGCCIRLPSDPEADIVIRYSSRNRIRLSKDGRILIIDAVDYQDKMLLDRLLVTVYRYACLVRADRIVCCPLLPLALIDYIDSTGVLDLSIS